MDIKLAREQIDKKPTKISIKKLEEMIDSSTNGSFFYCDKENTEKEMGEIVKYFEKKHKRVFVREVRYGLDMGDFMYEVHVL